VTFFFYIVLLIVVTLYFGSSALGALRSGNVTLFVSYNGDRHLSRRANPAVYWTVVCWYLLLAAFTGAITLLAVLRAVRRGLPSP
jgi:hypothetical protein